MSEEARESELARRLADILDGKPAHETLSDLTAELETLDEIGRVIEPEGSLPARLSGHRVLEEIGSGGMGRVFLALDEALSRRVAIKTLAPLRSSLTWVRIFAPPIAMTLRLVLLRLSSP